MHMQGGSTSNPGEAEQPMNIADNPNANLPLGPGQNIMPQFMQQDHGPQREIVPLETDQAKGIMLLTSGGATQGSEGDIYWT